MKKLKVSGNGLQGQKVELFSGMERQVVLRPLEYIQTGILVSQMNLEVAKIMRILRLMKLLVLMVLGMIYQIQELQIQIASIILKDIS